MALIPGTQQARGNKRYPEQCVSDQECAQGFTCQVSDNPNVRICKPAGIPGGVGNVKTAGPGGSGSRCDPALNRADGSNPRCPRGATCAADGTCGMMQNPRGGAADCSRGQTACQTNASCVSLCGAGWTCRSGACAPAGQVPGTTNPLTPQNPPLGGTQCQHDWQCRAHQCPQGQVAGCSSGVCSCSAQPRVPVTKTVDCERTLTNCTDQSGCSSCMDPPGKTGQWRCETYGTGRRCRFHEGPGADCTNTPCPDGKHCHPTLKRCVQCMSDDHCPQGQTCEGGNCEGGDGPQSCTIPCNPEEPGAAECVQGGGTLDNTGCTNNMCRCKPGREPHCSSDADCTDPTKPKCHTSSGQCYDPGGPTPEQQCPDGQFWSQAQRKCIPRTSGTRPEFPGLTVPTFTTTAQIPGTRPTDTVTEPTLPDPDWTLTEEDLKQDPGYKFRLQQGLDAIKANMNARGMSLSGDMLKAASAFAQQQATQEYQNAWNRRNARYKRVMESALTQYGIEKETFARALLLHGEARKDFLLQLGLDETKFKAAMETLRMQLGMNEQQFNQWYRIWSLEETNKANVLRTVVN